MRLLCILFLAAGAGSAATSYTATNLRPAESPYQIANVYGLNNHGQVLADFCTNGNCSGVNRFPGVWSNGVITPLPIPSGYTYLPQPAYYAINDSGTIVGTLQTAGGTNPTHVVVWTNGVPAVLPDAPIPTAGACAGVTSTTGSASFGINRAGHILGSTGYGGTGFPQGCGLHWVYNSATGVFRVLEYGPYEHSGVSAYWSFPIPAQCAALPTGYYPGVGLGFGGAMNDGDVVLQNETNFFCGPPYASPGVPWSSSPFLTQTNNGDSFLPLGSLGGASAGQINNAGVVHGFVDDGGTSHIIVWDSNGIHDLGASGYGWLNNAGQMVYLDTSHSIGGSCYESGCFAIWQNGVSSPMQLPAGLFGADDSPAPGPLNDAGQFVAGDGLNFYLLSPEGACAEDVTSQVRITRTGFRYNHSTGLFSLIGSITNTGGSPIAGPISLVVDNLSTNASLYDISGSSLCAAPQGSPYINIGNIGPGQVLAPGASISGSINFIDTAQTGITYSLRVLAGSGSR